MGPILDCLHLEVNLKKKIYQYVNSTTQRWPHKIFKTFLIENFLHLQISPQIFEKFETPLTGYSGAWEKLIHEKYLKSKISWNEEWQLFDSFISNPFVFWLSLLKKTKVFFSLFKIQNQYRIWSLLFANLIS